MLSEATCPINIGQVVLATLILIESAVLWTLLEETGKRKRHDPPDRSPYRECP